MEPTTLQDAILYFADPANCREYLVARRWPMAWPARVREQEGSLPREL